MGPTEAQNHDSMIWNFFKDILKYMMNQQLIFVTAVLDLIIMIKGLDLDCGTHTVGFQSQENNPEVNDLGSGVRCSVFSLISVENIFKG